jgi:hypothetical protein
MSLELMVATIFVLAKLKAITDFQPKFCPIPTLHDANEPVEPFLVHAMLFVGSIWRDKCG